MRRARLVVWLSCTCVLWVVGCRPTPRPVVGVEESQGLAGIIAQVTGSRVPRYGPVVIRFTKAFEGRVTDEQALTKAFSFSPPLAGTARWVDERTLVFAPSSPLTPGSTYSAVVDLPKILRLEDVDRLKLEFQVVPTVVQDLQASFEIPEATPDEGLLQGRVQFSDSVPTSELAKARLTVDGKPLRVEWTGGPRVFTFKAGPVARAEEPRKARLVLPAEPLGLERDITHETELKPRGELGILEVEAGGEEGDLRITVHFTEPLAQDQDVSAHIAVQPYVDTKTVVVGKTVHLGGAFDRDATYTLVVRKGIRGRGQTVLKETLVREVAFGDLPPRLEFSQSGAFLPSAGERTIGFRTLNVKRVRVRVTQVFESNLGQFLQDYDLASPKTRGQLWGDLERVGVQVAAETLDMAAPRNRWVQGTLDLSKFLAASPKGLFVVELSMSRDDVLYRCPKEQDWYPWDNPCGWGYYYQHGEVTKPVVVSDIGLVAKRAGSKLLVAATHLLETKPLPGVRVTLYSYQNQPIQTALTGSDGTATLDSTAGFYLVGEWNDQRTALKFSESGLSFESFDVHGERVSGNQPRAFVYSDRGVYRPGDTVHVAVIVREPGGGSSQTPLTMRVRNPRGQLVVETVNREGIQGHWGFSFATAETDPTGLWRVEIWRGMTLLAEHRTRIETVAPQRLKVNLVLPKDTLTAQDRQVPLTLRSTYLFGVPAAGLAATVSVRYADVQKTFATYGDYTFTIPSRPLNVTEQELFDGTLGDDGTAQFVWEVPPFRPGAAVVASLTARVFERGGRPSLSTVAVPIDPYDHYVGVKAPSSGWVKTRVPLTLAFVVMDRHGRVVPGRQVKVSVYLNARFWWWHVDEEDAVLKFKTDLATELVTTTTLVSGTQPVSWTFTPEEGGQLLIEAEDEGGHACGFFAWASAWGEEGTPMAAGTHLQMESTKASYSPGEKAIVTVRTPPQGLLFVTVEKADEILSHRWIPLEGSATKVEVDITPQMVPNVYVTALAIQPYGQTANDRPLRLYGALPLQVEARGTKLAVRLEVPRGLKPREKFSVQVRAPGSGGSATVAVVDEGLLDLTSFKTPDPWKFFYAKEGLLVTTFDVFDQVIGVLTGEVHRRFKVGGDEEAFRLRQAPPRARRFEPVAMFQGPVALDRQGAATFTFTMPNYMGSVRVMAVVARDASFGSADTTVLVREPLVLLASLPRVVGPGETFSVPATVFATEEGIREVRVKVDTEGPLELVGPAPQPLSFSGVGEQDVPLTFRAAQAVGVAKVRVEAAGAGHRAWEEVSLPVRPANPYLYGSKELVVRPGEKASVEIPASGLPGSGAAKLRISSSPGLRFGGRLRFLSRFPYGCLEQTISAAFPSLRLRDLVPFTQEAGLSPQEAKARVERTINAAVDKLRTFEVPGGGFATWPGGTTADQWATNYAGHFLLEARAEGFFVPSDMIASWLRFQKRMAAAEAGDYKTRCYRLYLLSLAGEPAWGPMNLMKEERVDLLDPVSRWYLAAAYLLAGMESAGAELLAAGPDEIPQYRETGGTYGSTLRDKAMLLELASLMGKEQTALSLFQEVSTALADEPYLSSQEMGYGLLAVGKYLRSTWDPQALVKATVEVEGMGSPVSVETRGRPWEMDLSAHMGRKVSVLSRSSQPIYVVAEWEGIPLEGPREPETRNMSLQVRWLNDQGVPIDPSRLAQHTTFWCHLTVRGKVATRVENVALTQIFPSGWEIDSARLTEENLPSWAQTGVRLGGEEYVDVRDDRVMWFFDLTEERRDFAVRLVAVTRGTFSLPPTVAEAMYDHAYRALVPGKVVVVE